MKLITAIVNDHDGQMVLEALNKEGFSVTKLATTGSFLKVGNMTLIIGTEDNLVQKAIDTIKSQCHRRKQVVITPHTLKPRAVTQRVRPKLTSAVRRFLCRILKGLKEFERKTYAGRSAKIKGFFLFFEK